MRITCDTKDTLPLSALTEFQGGLKKRTADDIGKIEKSIQKYGFATPFFVWRHDGVNHVLDGHGRLQTLKEMAARGEEMPALPVVYVECKDDAAAKNLLLRINSAYGTMTADTVRDFINEINVDIEDVKLPCGVIDLRIGITDETQGDDNVPDADDKKPALSKRGEMYELGSSVLMCGDSTDGDDVARLTGGRMIDVGFCSPPYGVVDGSIRKTYVKGAKKEKNFYNEYNDDMSNWLNLMDGFTRNMIACTTQCFINVQMLADNRHDFVTWLGNFNTNIVDIIVWNKVAPPQMQKNILNNGFEFIVILGQDGNTRTIASGNFHGNISNVIECRKEQNQYADIHKAVFPVGLVEKIIEINGNAETFLDLFGGTGTTLIACEKHGKKSMLMEIDPLYCDVIRRRYTKWAKENGKPITSGCIE